MQFRHTPYIPKKDRAKLDAAIDTLADRIVDEAREYDYDGAFADLLNYSCTCLARRVIRKRFGKMRYWLIAMVTRSRTPPATRGGWPS